MKLTSDLLDINVTTSSFVLLVKFCLPSSQQDCSVSLLLRMSVSVAFGVLCRIKHRIRRINYHYTRWSKGQNRVGRFRCLTCSTLTVGLRDGDGGHREKGKSRQTAGGKRKKKREERVVTYFPKSCTFFTGVGFHMLRMFFVRSC